MAKKRITRKFEDRKQRRDQLLHLFAKDSGYQELHLDGQVFVKHWDNRILDWVVAEYTEASFSQYKAYRVAKGID